MGDSQREQYPTRDVTNRPQNWSLTTTSTSSNQEIGSRTVPKGKHFCIQAIIVEVYLTTLSTTAVYLGKLSIQWDGSDIFGPFKASNTSSGALFGLVIPIPGEYILEGDGSKKLAAVCTPDQVTSTVWKVTIIGYERD